ncbi:hypothetical protein [Halorussus lipolyticus]|uniref:hypothetical protein n=1 Tax=Halorussus lipolyticus TaxID=3034024 RepID=UPI0023E89F1D|nr:hypothetical protein [Halorussus sp. DT80]
MRRREFLIAGASVAGITSYSLYKGKDLATLDRILIRSDTHKNEQLEITLIYAPQNDSTERPVVGSYVAPATGEIEIIEDFKGNPGIYSLSVYSQNHNNGEVASFNSYGDAVKSSPLQFEIVVKESGDVWANIDETDSGIQLPD